MLKLWNLTLIILTFSLTLFGTFLTRSGVVASVHAFTQGSIGRLDPKTGQTKEWTSPSGTGSQPYALAVVDDIVWYNESGMRPDALVRFDPKTEKFQSWAIPSGVGILRHMRTTPDGNLTIHQTSTNRIGLAMIGKPAASGSAPR